MDDIMDSCIVTSTSLNYKMQSLTANIRTLEDANSVVASRLALELLDEISTYIKSFKHEL